MNEKGCNWPESINLRILLSPVRICAHFIYTANAFSLDSDLIMSRSDCCAALTAKN